jgi:hypothetical protein
VVTNSRDPSLIPSATFPLTREQSWFSLLYTSINSGYAARAAVGVNVDTRLNGVTIA